ncbi:MAG: hypothetical protein WBN94_04185 [Methanothrix sp.]
MEVNTVAGIMAIVLIITGIAFTGIQLYKSLQGKELVHSRALTSEVGPVKFDLQTTYPGLIMICLGVLLLLVVIIKGN